MCLLTKIFSLSLVGGLISLNAFGQTTEKQIERPVNYYKNTPPRSTIPKDETSLDVGEQLFRKLCAECHEIGNQKIGPALANVTDRRPVAWLLAWINDSQQVISQGDAYGKYLYKSFSNYVMPDFEHLSKQEKLDILAYIQNESTAPTHVSGVNSDNDQ